MTQPSRSPIGRYQQLPLVGRHHECERLHQFLLETEQCLTLPLTMEQDMAPSSPLSARRSFVLLMGEVGIGKTRLAEEMAHEALQREWMVIWSRAYAQENGVPYRLWSQVLRDIMQRDLWPAHLNEIQLQLYQPLTTLLPELGDLLAAHTVDPAPNSGQEKQRLREALFALLIALAEQQGKPLLIALDDLQWTDDSSCELLGYLVRRLVDHPILLVGTVRENEIPNTHPLYTLVATMQHEGMIEQVPVEALTDEQIAILIAHVPQSLAQLIQSQVAGNPFFAEELARTYAVWGEGEKAHYEKNRLKLPRTIADVLDQRLQLLSPTCQGFLQRAAVIGGSLSFDSLCLMENSGNSSLNEDSLFSLIEEALQTKVLAEERSGTNIAYHFWHPLLMSHLYDKLSAIRRRRLHQRASEVFQQVYQTREGEGAAIIVHHLLQGSADCQQIAHYAELAADHAYTLAAYPAAGSYYQLAIEQRKLMPQAARADANVQLPLASLLESLGECLRFQGNFQDAGHCFEQALELHRQVYPMQALLSDNEEMLQEAQVQAMLCCGIGISWYDRGDCMQARKYYSSVETLLDEMEILGGSVWAYLYLQYSYAFWQEGRHKEAQNAAYKALNLFEVALQQDRPSRQSSDKNRLRRTLAGDPVDLGRTYRILGVLAAANGQLTKARSYLTVSLKVFEQYDYLREIAMVCCDLGDIFLRWADHPSAKQYLLRALDIAERIGEITLQCFVVGNLGQLALRAGKLAESENWYRRGIKGATQINNIYSICLLYSLLTLTLQEQGKFKEIAPYLRHIFSLQRHKDIANCRAMMWLALGYVRLAQILPLCEAENAIDLTNHPKIQSRLLSVYSAVNHIFPIPGVDIEIRSEAELLQAHTLLLLDRVEEAFQQATYILDLACKYEFYWLIARAKRLIASIQVRRKHYQDAEIYFEQAIQLFYAYNLGLEHARTLQLYGVFLLQQEQLDTVGYQRGLNYVDEARKFFSDRHASFDLQATE